MYNVLAAILFPGHPYKPILPGSKVRMYTTKPILIRQMISYHDFSPVSDILGTRDLYDQESITVGGVYSRQCFV